MKRKYWLTGLMICLSICLFCACAREEAPIPETTAPLTTTSAITSEIESTTETVTETAAPPRFDDSEIEQSHEKWLKVGLDYYLNDRRVNLDAVSYFKTKGVAALTLYNDWFTYDATHAEQVAALFFRYMMEHHGYEALFDLDRRVEYKDAFLKSLSPDLSYTNDPDGERVLSQMICDSNANYGYIIRLEGMTYCFVHYANDISLVHRLLYNNTVAVRKLKEYLRTVEGHEQYFNLERELRYNMPLQGGVSSTKNATKVMTINDSYAMLHETVHAMSLYTTANHLWLTEGVADYLGKSLGFDVLVNQTHYVNLYYAEQGMYDSYIAAGNQDALRYRKILDLYTAWGGKITSFEEMDHRLYIDACAAAQFAIPGAETVGGVYDMLNDQAYTGTGGELTYMQAASFTAYLIDRYGMETVLHVAVEQDRLEEIFGAPYDTLYAEWYATLSR